MDSESLKLYEALYEAARSQMADGFHFTKEAFLYSVEGEPNVVDARALSRLDNRSFLTATYVGLFNRTPDTGALARWEEKMALPPAAFQRELMDSLLSSLEYRLRRVRVLNDWRNPPGGGRLIRHGEKIKPWIDRLYHVYMRFPEPVKRPLRRLLKR